MLSIRFSVTDNTQVLLGALPAAQEAGLIASSQVLINALKRELRGGYTSGKFTTGVSINKVTRGKLEMERGVPTMRVGTTQTDPPYPLFWELGHWNIFTRSYIRRQVWKPTLIDQQDALARKYAQVVTARLQRELSASVSQLKTLLQSLNV